jgi:sodium transport system permease protein
MIKTLLRKEALDSFRDRRSILAALFGAFFGPILFALMMSFSIDKARSLDDIYIEINNPEQAAHLVELLEVAEIYHVVKPDKGKKITVDGEEKKHSGIVITFSETFAEDLSKAKPANITLNADYSEKSTGSEISRVKKVFRDYQGGVIQTRLMTRGISPEIAKVIDLEEQDTSSASSKSAIIMGMMGVMVMFSVFVASTNVAIDCSAGERERNSLELLLMQPVSTFDVVASKTINVGMFGMVAATLNLVLTAIVVPFIPLHKMGMAFNFNIELAMTIWLLMLPLAFFAAAFQLVTTFHAKTFKEAQSYIQYTIMIPVFVPMALEIANYKSEFLNYIPVVSQQQAISQIIRGESLELTSVLAGGAITIAVTYGLVKFIAKSLKSEKVVLGL